MKRRDKRGITVSFLNALRIFQIIQGLEKKSKAKIGTLFFFLLLIFIFLIWVLQSLSVPTWTNPDAVINSTSGSNFTQDNITVNGIGGSGSAGEGVKYFYNWFLDNESIAVLNMPFEGDSPTAVQDYSGFNNSGTVYGAVFNSTGGYDSFGAFEFDGIDDHINISDSDSLNILSELSVAFWFKRKDLDWTTATFLVAKANTLTANEWHLRGLTGETIGFRLDNSSGQFKLIYTTTTFADTDWHFIVGTYDKNGYLNLYVDGNNEDSDYLGGDIKTSTNYNITIGSNTFNGTIDGVMIFNRSLSNQQILALYNNETNKIVSQETLSGEMWHAAVYLSNGSAVNPAYYNTTQMEVLENLTALFAARELLGRPTNNSVTVNMVNGDNNISVYAEYRNSSYSSGNYPFNTTILSNVGNKSLIELTIGNLTPDTAYYYRVRVKRADGSRYQISEEKSFRTKRDAAPFNFTLISDAHITTLYSPATRSIALKTILGNIAQNDNPDFVIGLGDNVESIYYGGYDHTFGNESYAVNIYEQFRRDLEPEIFRAPLFFLIGNWEGEDGWVTADNITYARNARQKYIPNPDNTTYPEGGGPNEDYFAFTWGNALFVIINVQGYVLQVPSNSTSYTLGSAQLEWLNQTLRSSNQTWKFIFAHHAVGTNMTGALKPAYGRGGGRAAYVGEQNTIHELMKNNGVQAIFIGHDHCHTDIPVDGIHYTVVPSTGHGSKFCVGSGYAASCEEGGTVCLNDGYSCYNQNGRVKVEVVSDEIVNVNFINISEVLVANYTMDRISPRISLNVSPQTGTVDTDGHIIFNYNSTDFSISNCSLYLNKGKNQTNSSVTKDIVQNFSLNLSAGSYTWAVKCFDTAGNLGSSENRTLIVVKAAATGLSIKNLSQVDDISNISSFFIKNPYGVINFTTAVNLSDGADINAYVNVSFNRIEVNSTALPNLNKTARLTLSNLTFNDPQVLKDGDVCASCAEVSYSGGTFVFDVTSFSVYTTRETPQQTTTGGGGGGTKYSTLTTHSFNVYPETIETILKPEEQKELNIKITNDGDVKLKFAINIEGVIKDIIIISETDFQLTPNEGKLITLSIKPKENIDYGGKLLIKADGLQKEIPITLTMKEEQKPTKKEEAPTTEATKEIEEVKKPAKKTYTTPIIGILILLIAALIIFSLTKTGRYQLLMLTKKAGITKISKEKELELKREQQKPSPIIKEVKQLTEQTAKTLQKATKEVEKTATETKKALAKLKPEEKPTKEIPKDQPTRDIIEKLLKEANQQLQKNKQKEAEAIYEKIRQHYKSLSWKGKKEYSQKILQLYKKILETRKK